MINIEKAMCEGTFEQMIEAVDMMASESVEFHLPIFEGFYHSYHSIQIDNCEEFEINNMAEDTGNDRYYYDNLTSDFDIDYGAIHTKYAQEFTDNFISYIADDILKDTGIEVVEFKTLSSPRYYNFDTDRINTLARVDTEKLIAYISTAEFAEYIADENKSYDGFFSYMESNIDAYIDEIEAGIPGNIVTQVLNYWIESKGDNLDVLGVCSDIDTFEIFLNNITKKEDVRDMEKNSEGKIRDTSR